MPDQPGLSAATRAVRASIATDTSYGAVVPPIHLSSNFAFEAFGRPRTYDYTRSGNPTRSQLADALADLEGGATASVTSTGMSAVALVLQLVRPGDTVVAAHDCYGGTQRLLRALSARGHFDVSFVDLTGPDAVTEIELLKPRLVWVETPSNPLLRITDLRLVLAAARLAGAISVVDNTFLSPVLQRPVDHGADIVVHSTTKYLNGHSDVVGGAVIAADQAIGAELAWWANCLGISGAPFDSYLTLRGVRTLHARMAQHLANTELVVDALCRHEAVERIYYPGLASHPGHAVARAQQRGFGAMVSFELAGGVEVVERFTAALRCFTLAESLGGVESLIAHPATMTHASMDAAARAVAGINESLLRLSVGIEAGEDLTADLTHALDAVLTSSSRDRGLHVSRSASPRPQASRDVILLGVGAIGRELLDQFGASRDGDDRIRVCGLVDRSGFVFDAAGLTRGRLRELRTLKAAGHSLIEAREARPGTAADVIEIATGQGMRSVTLVDVTAADTTQVLRDALAYGWDVVLANKVPVSGDRAAAKGLHDAAARRGSRLLYEATVGAGLPVIDTLRKLIDAGDDVLAIEGCPSGTLGYLFGEMGRGTAFSTALRAAIQAGYTEPDPRVDLSGLDVARKALILARALGYEGEIAHVEVECLVPDELREVSLGEFLDRVEELDEQWARRAELARDGGRVLRYRARVTPESVAVGLSAVAAGDPLATLTGTDNQFAFTTTRYRLQPLVITGPGAGAAVTAAGVYNDVLRIVAERGSGVRATGSLSLTDRPDPVRRSSSPA